MKIRYPIAAAVTLTALAATCVLANAFSRQLTQGDATITDISGDRSCTEGVTLTANTGYKLRPSMIGPIWTAEFTPAAGTSRIEYEFDSNPDSETRNYDEILWESDADQRYFDLNFYDNLMSGNDDGELFTITNSTSERFYGLPRQMFLDAADSVSPGSKQTMKLRLSDTCSKIYPVVQLYWDFIDEEPYFGQSEDLSTDCPELDAIAELFAIPVPKDTELNLTITKNAEGKVSSIDYSYSGLFAQTYSCRIDNRLYFCSYASFEDAPEASSPGNRFYSLDIGEFQSLIHALYRTPWDSEGTPLVQYLSKQEIYDRALDCLHPCSELPDDFILSDLSASADSHQIHLLGYRGDVPTLMVYDPVQNQIIQTLDLPFPSTGDTLPIYTVDIGDCLLASLGDMLTVLTRKDSEYTEWGTFAMPALDALTAAGVDLSWVRDPDCEEAVDTAVNWLDHATTCSSFRFDGDRLVFLTPLTHRYDCPRYGFGSNEVLRICNQAELMVFDRDGLTYHGVVTFDIPGSWDRQMTQIGNAFTLE